MLSRSFHLLRVLDVVAETPSTKSLVLEIPPGLEAQFSYAPGQFLTFRIPAPDGTIMRCYSMASSPHTGEELKVTVKRVPDGVGSNWICDHVVAGDTVDVLPPAGTFTPASLDDDFILFAGGSGITPVMSILKSALLHGRGRILLIYANRSEDAVIFGEELRALAGLHPQRLSIVHWLDTLLSMPTPAQLAALIGGWGNAQSFICGPGPFMDAAAEAVLSTGADSRHMHIERFIVEEDVPPADADAQHSTLEVSLEGQTTELVWPAHMRMLDVLLKAGIRAPYSCRMGACCACAWRVTEGDVEMAHNEVLDKSDLDEGWVLSCQAIPKSAKVKISVN